MTIDCNGYVKQTLTTETGEQEAIALDKSKQTHIVIVSGNTSDDSDLEYTLDNPRKSGAVWHKYAENVNGSAVLYRVHFAFPVQGVRLDIDGDNSHTKYMEVLQS